jgi:uncharacterized membrane protein
VSWRRVFHLRLDVRDSRWVLPLAAAVLGAVLGSALLQLDKSVHVPPGWHYSSSTAGTILTRIVVAMTAVTGILLTVGG